MAPLKLETPRAPEHIYTAHGTEVAELKLRPLFTGDVFQSPGGARFALVQHPCAMRKGLILNPKLLAAGIVDTGEPFRSDWSKARFSQTYLPLLFDGKCAVDFDDLFTVGRDSATPRTRIAILSICGVSLLMQRWVHYNTRVVIPTPTLTNVIAGPFEEADLTAEAVDRLVAGAWTEEDALRELDRWFGTADGQTREPPRIRLTDPVQRTAVRHELRRHVTTTLGR